MSHAPITQRKQDHIDWILKDDLIERNQSGFDKIKLTHRALPECDFAEIDSQTQFLSRPLAFPMLISSMTGGATQQLAQTNRHLAEAAEASQVAMAVGSQRTLVEDQEALQSFQLRRYAPNIPLIANMGAVQLNYGFGFDQAKLMIDTLEADALFLHLNPLQEVIQPEGDTNFARLTDKIEQLASELSVPVILKEVGCGLSATDIQLGLNAGIKWFDIAGRGGTSWSRIEANRSSSTSEKSLGVLFQDWGLTTPEALMAARPFQDQANFIASGGIRNGIDMVKSVIIGGQICGLAAPLLKPALESSAATYEKIQQLHQEFRTAQFLLGAPTLADLFLNDALIVS
ncbi:type 2 isopentenyl-diphosphate Delta-isomerase [Hydrogenovibrio sp. SC-1]|uniref:type 2 isopentenyl-diphosphate Delta-isomerase n=1 Tax=Hydrogenovibrio sp. SC-1 TaxID=2065820 RepID=UPI000C7C73CE|nr:type 2 isopentenyl-diphosphate Delta-isomerase [Hydrogenovibrio sp. SC-1]PLA74121.1 type 2 isopentenyl-diphosphate Delta-isomerase [Hydrogenovibrio sp. SC-1]